MGTGQSTHLARRLRELRRAHWPDLKITQPELGQALGVGAPSISSWESGKSTPPPSRLNAYATFFATRRSVVDGLRLLSVDKLTEDERRVQAELASELDALARGVGRTAGEPTNLWHFPDGRPVRLLCGEIPRAPLRRGDFADDDEERETQRSKFASGGARNYIQLMAYADLDSLVELFGHIRAQNPMTDVRFDREGRLKPDDLQGHLVIIGNWTSGKSLVTRLMERAGVPISQIPDPDKPAWSDDGEIFEVPGSPPTHFRPTVDGSGKVTEDVGLFVRVRNPYNRATTLTVVSGVFTRGGYGAARMLTHDLVRDRNEDALAKLFPNAEEFYVLLRVPVEDHTTVTPDITVPGAVLHQWSKD